MVLVTATTSSQNTTRAPSTSQGSRGEEEEQLNSNPIQVSLATRKFVGRLRHFLSAWSTITSDQNILDIVQHCHLEIGNSNQTRPRSEIQFDSNEKEIIDSEMGNRSSATSAQSYISFTGLQLSIAWNLKFCSLPLRLFTAWHLATFVN